MNRRMIPAGATLSVLALILVSVGFSLVSIHEVGQEVRQYVGGPFGAQLLYLQGCAIDNMKESGRPGDSDTLQEQIDYCQRAAQGGRAGYYVYDFNIRRSARLSKADMKRWNQYSVLSFPASITGRVGNSETNPFNHIVPFEEFGGFDYDCALAQDGARACRKASASCLYSNEAIRCAVFNPRTEQTEEHSIEAMAGLDLLLPQGFITGPDLFKMLKPRFFPHLVVSNRGILVTDH